MGRSLSIFCLFISAVLAACSTSSIVTSAFQNTYTLAVDERSLTTLASDKEIEWLIENKIVNDQTLDVLNITPYCFSGDVYLVGEYKTLDEVKKVSDMASQMEGVESVALYFVQRGYDPSCGWVKDLSIHMKVSMRLIHDKDIHSTNVNVKVVQCHVVLVGIVGSPEEIIQAIALAEDVEGVKEVKSFLRTTSRGSDSSGLTRELQQGGEEPGKRLFHPLPE
ncbi:MAG TPA: BON domain-containing protein [Syntrophales bacterium]|nr:BON domain-containing protein [Syntrophales bacterium]